jgi:hypothetical protein
MEAKDTMHELETGDKLTVNTHAQTFTVTETMFDGEMIDMEGPQGGEKSLVENVNTGSVAILNGGDKEGTVTEINVE